MRYLGGKGKIGRRLADAILTDMSVKRFGHVLELCAGGGNMTYRLADRAAHVTAVEAHKGLVEMHSKVQSGWVPPTVVTRDEHAAAIDPTDSLHAFIRFACSFSGVWGSGYIENLPAQTKITRERGKSPRVMNVGPQSWAADTSRLLVKARRANVTWVHGDALTCDVPGGVDVVYIDPPYEGTTGYRCVARAVPGAWWRRAVQIAATGVPVYMSEASGPPEGVSARLVLSHALGQRRMHTGSAERIELLWRVGEQC